MPTEVRQIVFQHFGQIMAACGANTWESTVESKTRTVLARAIATTPEALIVTREAGSASIPWDECSVRLARASFAERSQAKLSPPGYGIHWPLIDEDLAVGPLLLRSSPGSY
jgi:hypothetical protein